MATESTVYLNGLIYTVDRNGKSDWSKNPKDALVIENGKISFVGTDSDEEEFISSNTEVIDLKKAVVLPGLHDVHLHPLEAGSPVGGTVELPRDTSPEKMIETMKRSARRQKGTKWVLGHGYSLHSMLDHIESGGRQPKEILDEALPNTPAVMMEETSHSVWVNSKALALAGISKDTPNLTGGVIMKDRKPGEPNGILLENAGNAIIDIAMKPTAELEEFDYQRLLESIEKLSENGITSICDARCYWKHGDQRLRRLLGIFAFRAASVCQQRQLTVPCC